MAHAKIGFLDRDWLANTADPTPVFNKFIELTYRILNWEPIFYGYYALLMGIYFYSLYGIARSLFSIEKSLSHKLFFIASFFLIHSAGLRFVLSRLIGINWTYILEDGVADQRMLGSVFQPSTFGVFLLLSIYLFLNNHKYLAVASACLAAIFHPTYLLSAALLTCSYIVLIYRESREIKQTASLGLMALILVSPIVYRSFSIFTGDDAFLVEKARQILITFRIPHHAIVSQWFDATAIVKILFMLLALWIIRNKSVFTILLIPFCTAVVLTIIQVILKNQALALLFPWRVSIFLVPISVTILVAHYGSLFIDEITIDASQNQRIINWCSMALISLAVISGASRFTLDLIRKENIPERALFTYVLSHKQSTDLYLTPSKMQDFRLETGAPVFIDFKSIPYKETDVIEWYRRITLNNHFYQDMDCSILASLIKHERVTHIVIDTSSQFKGCPFISLQYQDANFQIFRAGN